MPQVTCDTISANAKCTLRLDLTNALLRPAAWWLAGRFASACGLAPLGHKESAVVACGIGVKNLACDQACGTAKELSVQLR